MPVRSAEMPQGIMQSRAKSFSLAARFLPAALRSDVQMLYAYYRLIDDLVDEPQAPGTDVAQLLDDIERSLRGHSLPCSPYVSGVRDVAERHAIPLELLIMVIDGARCDLALGAIQTHAELIQYSVLVAGSVGMVMSHLMAATHHAALSAASDLGVAMQLTNILRDVGEDLERGRIYLPATDLARRGCSVESLRRGQLTPQLSAVVSEIAAEARELYSRGSHGIRYLDPSSRFAIALAATLYARILDKIELNGHDVLRQRAHLGSVEKWRSALPLYARHRLIPQRA